jgi:hypothetical protein
MYSVKHPHCRTWVLIGMVVAALGCDSGAEEVYVAGPASGGSGAAPATGGVSGTSVGTGGGDTNLVWREANLTWYESYPDPNSEECLLYSGCEYSGMFAMWPGEVQPESWVQQTNIAAVHSDDWDTYRGKVLRVRQEGRQIDVNIYDVCVDSDCDGCCTRNSAETGFLIDMEINTANRFGSEGGIVQWACLDC